MTQGIHHVTAITANVQANVDFYAGFLGLKLVKQTAGYEDADQLHLFYGDALGSPGSVLTFLVWQDGARGRTGLGQVLDISLAVPTGSIGEWLTRAMTAHIPVEGPSHEFGETVLRLRDPDGLVIKLVAADLPALAPLPDPIAPTRIRGVSLLGDQPDQTAAFLARFGYAADRIQNAVQRLVSDHDVIDLRNGQGYVPGVPGAGVVDHLALRAPDKAAVLTMQDSLGEGFGATNLHDRKYFHSLYMREPAGTLLEYASDGPGFTVDESSDQLGRNLFLPPFAAGQEQDLRVRLPQFSMPGEDRIVMRDLPFTHRFFTPENPDGSVILLLHGTGGSESDLMPLAHRIAPRASLLGVRGRAHDEGVARWFRRVGATQFDQQDIRAEADAFAAFVEGAIRAYGIDPARMTALGYSNGANFAAAVMGLHPGGINSAILLRAMPVLEELPDVDLQGAKILLLAGRDDPYGQAAPRLAEWLRDQGADLRFELLALGHGLEKMDQELAAEWLMVDGA